MSKYWRFDLFYSYKISIINKIKLLFPKYCVPFGFLVFKILNLLFLKQFIIIIFLITMQKIFLPLNRSKLFLYLIIL